MTTNPPKAPYGHYPASLGGKGMGEPRQDTDVCWLVDKWTSAFCHHDMSLAFVSHLFYTRPIDPGPEHELVGEDEYIKGQFDYTEDGFHWNSWLVGTPDTVKNLIHNKPLLAIRRKVVKEQWPKYAKRLESSLVYRQCCQTAKPEFHMAESRWESSSDFESITDKELQQITPSRAFELTGDKSILGKEGGETSHGNSNDIIHINNGFQPSPEISQEKVGASSPAWISVSERLPDKESHFILGRYQGGQWVQSECMKYSGYPIIGWSHFLSVQVPPPPQPKTQQEKDEEWFDREFPPVLFKSASDRGMVRCAVNTALAYARGEKVESK